jgi:glycosyltransferase involved in cell wall biosynthesis
MIPHATLGIVTGMPADRHGGDLYVHLSFGRVVDSLARRYAKVLLCVPVRDAPPGEDRDYRLEAGNIELIPQPMYGSCLGAMKHLWPIARAYWDAARRADALFVRGMLPHAGALYFACWRFGRRPCHWIIGDPVALLRSHSRHGRLRDSLGLLYALQDRFVTKVGRRATGGSFLCNGEELAAIHLSPRTDVVVSTTLREDELFPRDDTCARDPVRLLFIGFVRPEKGVEYLIDALPRLRTRRPCELTIVGPWEKYPAYKRKLDDRVSSFGVEGSVRWEGYVSYGPRLWQYLRDHDVFVLPTLSEGTPRVLVEARANGIPVIATNVGGIPTSVQDGVDGLLVPPKDAGALARAIDRVIGDDELRRRLIRNGLVSVRKMTVDRFAEKVVTWCNEVELGSSRKVTGRSQPSQTGESDAARWLGS